MSFDYLKNIYNCYECFFSKKKEWPSELTEVPILELDVSNDFKNDTEMQRKNMLNESKTSYWKLANLKIPEARLNIVNKKLKSQKLKV